MPFLDKDGLQHFFSGIKDRFLRVDDQALTNAQKTQVRSNIGAAASSHNHNITDLSGTLSVEKGGTGATSAATARSNIGAASMKTSTASLSVAGWSGNEQTVSVSGVTASNAVVVTPSPASHEHYAECMVRCSAQSAGKLTFTCSETPTEALSVNVLILE